MIDLQFIRQQPEKFDEIMLSRGHPPCAQKLIILDDDRRQLIQKIQLLQHDRNELSKKMALFAKANPSDKDDVIKLSHEIAEEIKAAQEKLEKNDLETAMQSLPNILSENVPVGNSENDNECIRNWGDIPKMNFTPKHHYELGVMSGLLDFEQTALISGNRFCTMWQNLARLERVLIDFMIEHHISKYGFMECSTPYLVKSDAMFGTGQLPKFADDAFKTDNNYYLIPTGEVPLLNMFREKIIKNFEKPIRVTGFTPCFRKEAGSTGSDARGMIRQHQFGKVEMVSLSPPEYSYNELDLITDAAESLLKALKLPYRVVALCSSDIGFSAAYTYDLEVWFPSQNKYREISSCSNCESFQARRMKIRYKDPQTKKNLFVHTLNGSGLAVGRTLAAIMENYQKEDGSIGIPEVLQQKMGCKYLVKMQQSI